MLLQLILVLIKIIYRGLGIQCRKPWKKDMAEFMERERKRRNAFWYAHKALNSKSKLVICHINNLPDELELHDIGIIFSVLTHIRDPYTALLRCALILKKKL